MLLLLLEVHPLAAPEAAAPTCVWLLLAGVLLPPRHMYPRLLELSQLHWLAAVAASCCCWLRFYSPCSGCRCWLLLAEEPCKGLRLQLAADLFQLLLRKHLLRLAAGLLLLLLRWLLLLLLTAEMPCKFQLFQPILVRPPLPAPLGCCCYWWCCCCCWGPNEKGDVFSFWPLLKDHLSPLSSPHTLSIQIECMVGQCTDSGG